MTHHVTLWNVLIVVGSLEFALGLVVMCCRTPRLRIGIPMALICTGLVIIAAGCVGHDSVGRERARAEVATEAGLPANAIPGTFEDYPLFLVTFDGHEHSCRLDADHSHLLCDTGHGFAPVTGGHLS